MSVDLLELVDRSLSESVLGKLKVGLGDNPELAQPSIVQAATRGILGGIVQKATSPGGANAIFLAIQQQESGVLERLGDLLGSVGKRDIFVKNGAAQLELIFGSDLDRIRNLIAQGSGADVSRLNGLLCLLAPVIMAVIGRHVKNKSLNGVGLASLMADQKFHVGDDLPVGSFGQSGPEAVRNIDSQGAQAGLVSPLVANSNSDNAIIKRSKFSMKFIIPFALLGLCAVGGVWWYVIPRVSTLKPEGEVVSPRFTEGRTEGDSSITPGAPGGSAPGMAMRIPADVDMGKFDLDGMYAGFAKITKGFTTLTETGDKLEEAKTAAKEAMAAASDKEGEEAKTEVVQKEEAVAELMAKKEKTVDGMLKAIQAATEKMDSYGIADLDGRRLPLALQTIKSFRKLFDSSMETVTDSGIKEKLAAAIQPLYEKLDNLNKK